MTLTLRLFLNVKTSGTHINISFIVKKKTPEVCFYFDIYVIWLRLNSADSALLSISPCLFVLVNGNIIKIRILQ